MKFKRQQLIKHQLFTADIDIKTGCHYCVYRWTRRLVLPRGKFDSTNQKHYPDLGSDASSVWNSALASQTSLHGETSGGVLKCGLFSQATV